MKALALCGAALLLVGCSESPGYDLAIAEVSVINVVTGEVSTDRHIGIRDGKIAYIGSAPAAAKVVVGGDGRWAIPGLWDMHVHISDPSFFALFISNGIVGVRDMGGAAHSSSDGCESIEYDTLRRWQIQIQSGVIRGPDIVMAGPVLSGTGSASALDASSPEKAGDAVSRVASMGADFVKVYEDIPYDAFVALADQAKNHGLPFAGHVSEESLRIIDAIHSGQRSIEHVRSHLLLCFASTGAELEELFETDGWGEEDLQWAAPHIESCPEIWQSLRRSDIWLTPTLAVQETLETATMPGFEHDQRRSALPDSIKDAVVERSVRLRRRTSAEVAMVENWNRFIFRLVARANQEGAKLLAGTDAACEGTIPGHSLHRELQLLEIAGLSRLRALQTATLEPASYLGREQHAGQLEPGFDADIVLLDRNPLDDIRNTQLVRTVIVRGEIAFEKAESR